MRFRPSILLLVVVAGPLALLPSCSGGGSSSSTASVASPTVQGPITPSSGISLLASTLFPLSQVGYEQSEYFLSGTATSYTSSSPLSGNGRWKVTRSATAPYKTRIVVYRPIDPKHFDGTVAVEWFNVSAGTDSAAAWLTDHVQMIRDGMAYVGVDAQSAGLNGAPGSLATSAGVGGIKTIDPARYASLVHPGDSFSYSIFQQVGEAVHASGAKVLGGLAPSRVLAVGESQSAFRLVTYIDAVQPQSPGIYDGYFIYSRGGDGADLSQSPQATISTPAPTYIRTDLQVPVFLFETEADLIGLGYQVARQPPTRYIREWEVAGTAHDDTYGLLYARTDTGNGAADTQAFQSMLDPPSAPIPGIVQCAAPINTGSHTYELRAAVTAANRWVDTGNAPQQSPRLDVNTANATTFMVDANGNAQGGIQTPQVQAPVAKLSGVGQPGSIPATQPGTVSTPSGGDLCGIFGTTVPFSAAKLSALYPSHAAFVNGWNAATSSEVKAGYLLPADAQTLDMVAAQSSVGG